MGAVLFGRFLIGVALTGLAVALAALLPDQAASVQTLLRLVILGLILLGLWQALGGRQRWRLWLAVGVPLLAWQTVVWWLALRGTFVATNPLARLLPVTFLLPLLIGLPLLLRSKSIGRMLDPSLLPGSSDCRCIACSAACSLSVGPTVHFRRPSRCQPAPVTCSPDCWRCRWRRWLSPAPAAGATSQSPGTCSGSWTSSMR